MRLRRTILSWKSLRTKLTVMSSLLETIEKEEWRSLLRHLGWGLM
jgi:hypothetical protein